MIRLIVQGLLALSLFSGSAVAGFSSGSWLRWVGCLQAHGAQFIFCFGLLVSSVWWPLGVPSVQPVGVYLPALFRICFWLGSGTESFFCFVSLVVVVPLLISASGLAMMMGVIMGNSLRVPPTRSHLGQTGPFPVCFTGYVLFRTCTLRL
jgi:hypothetical protein